MLLVSNYLRLLLLMLCFFTVHGILRFANYYQDHMVLQCAPQRAVVWGYVDTINTLITLTMDNKEYFTISRVSSAGAAIWSVTLDAQTGEGPFQVKVTRPLANGTLETIVLNDVLFGDVWICSGQSNMEFSVDQMFNASIEIENAYKYPKVRLFTAAHGATSIPQEELFNISMEWSVASNTTVANIHASAVCWLYGRMINEALGERPIGLVHSSWGGTDIEYWTPREALRACGILGTKLETNDLNTGASFEVSDVLNSTDLFNAMIYPFTRMVIKGVIWYQGENNVYYNIDKYNCTFSKMIEAWRNIWYTRTDSITDPTFPFGFVQLSTNDPTGTRIGGFPWIRWHQTFDVGYVPNNVVPNVFMAVALDLRDDGGAIHPRNKLDVGYRLSRSGLAVAYGFQNITYQGPIVADISVASDSSKINVTYSSVASSTIELRNSSGFEVCCDDKQICRSNDTVWEAALASRIEGAALTISLAVPTQCTSKPINGLRYLWKETPCLFKQAAVYNGEDSDLPAPPYIHYF